MGHKCIIDTQQPLILLLLLYITFSYLETFCGKQILPMNYIYSIYWWYLFLTYDADM